jgi:hypothetical protein
VGFGPRKVQNPQAKARATYCWGSLGVVVTVMNDED